MWEIEDSRVPVTIEELKELCAQRGINLYQLGFYLGSDHIGPNAYGVYKDYWTSDFIVYKNIEDGSKEVLYQGQDEATAVSKINEQLQKVLVNAGAENIGTEDIRSEHIWAEDIAGISGTGDSSYVGEENQSPNRNNVYSEDDNLNLHGDSESSDDNHVNSYGDSESSDDNHVNSHGDSGSSDDNHLNSYEYNTSGTGEVLNQKTYGEGLSDNDVYNSYTGGSLKVKESSENSWMDIQTPIMKAAPSEAGTKESDKPSSDDDKNATKEKEFTAEDVKDLKTGVIFCIGKLFYYLGRLCYYLSIILYYLFKAFDGAKYEINLILTGNRRSVKDRNNNGAATGYKEVANIDGSGEDNGIENGKDNGIDNENEAPVFFNEKEYDDKAELLGAKIQFYISRIFFYIGKYALKLSQYCYQGIDDKFKFEAEFKEADSEHIARTDTISRAAESEHIARTDVSGGAADSSVITKEYTNRRPDVSKSESDAYNNAETYKKADTYTHTNANTNTYTSTNTNANNNANTSYYRGYDQNLQSLIKNIDPDVELLTADSSETYDLTEIAEKYDDNTQAGSDGSIDDLFSSLDDEELEYPDNNEDYIDNKLGKKIYLFIVVALAAVLFLIFMMAGADLKAKSKRNDRNYYDYEYNTNSHNTYNNSWRW
ncbi:hypothetical protein [Butyrivibrio fibrisolvens]|uniref:hypothetical protein n=1 Tax=Butyrivibrio fibrisolvens TaxID=831 RepID=UPI0003F55CE9|nr:hypothetical protein [Butyrivibrio fibrisolvens]